MPFTFAHPAIVLPLKNKYSSKYFSLTGLIIGSIFPDFEYFIRMNLQSIYSHTVLGVFLFNLPLGLIFCFIFHNIIRNELFVNLPYFLRTRLSIYTKFNWNKYFLKNYIKIIISLLIGSISHVLWDSFTHVNGYFVKIISSLNYFIIIGDISIPIYKILQYSSTVFGCLIIFYVIIKLPKINNLNKISIMYWIVVCLIISIIFIVKIINGLNYKLYGEIIVTFISATFIALILAPMLRRLVAAHGLSGR
ncbi:MAG: DUF4184 family protein [Fibromonadaceae bacterium]|jgi:hypothetical protein|nr:DUF4184 family protein [Fibromonadaceae bacterium]